ncbi:MAG: ABC transporter ATP-binding protein [Mycobacteriales bacterium]
MTPVAAHVATRGLTKSFGEAASPAVSDVSLDLPAGSLTALLGPSGSGKSTLLNLIAGLLTPDAGDMLFAGQSVSSLPPERRPVAMVFQRPLLFPHLSVGDNVGFGLRMRGVPSRQRGQRVREMLGLVELDGYADRSVDQLSGGQGQRVALARALITEPSVLLLDEPFSQLDAVLRAQMRELLAALRRRFAVTTLFVTHDQAEAVEVADTIALLLDGRLEQQDEPRAFYERPRSIAVARFFGAANIIAGTLCGSVFDSALGTLAVAGRGAADGPGHLVIRPESLRLLPAGAAPGPNTVTGTLTRTEYRGTHLVLSVTVGPISLELLAPTGHGAVVGRPVCVQLPPEACTVL